MWIRSVAACAAVGLFVSTAAAARLDMWDNSTGTPGCNNSTDLSAGEVQIGWDLPSFGMIKVRHSSADGHYLAVVNDTRDSSSSYVRAEADRDLSAVFEFQYHPQHNAYTIVGVPFKSGPGTDDGWGANCFLTVDANSIPDDLLSNKETRVIVHQNSEIAGLWRFLEQGHGTYMMELVPDVAGKAHDNVGYYLYVPNDVGARDDHSRYVTVADAAANGRVTLFEIELP